MTFAAAVPIHQYLTTVFTPTHLVELRLIDRGGVLYSDLFDDVEHMADVAGLSIGMPRYTAANRLFSTAPGMR